MRAIRVLRLLLLTALASRAARASESHQRFDLGLENASVWAGFPAGDGVQTLPAPEWKTAVGEPKEWTTFEWKPRDWTPPDEAPAGTRRAPVVSGLPRFHLRIARDLGDLVLLPRDLRPRQWRTLGLAALGIGAAHLIDDEVRGEALLSDAGAKGLIDDIRPLGQEAGIALLGLAWLGGRSLHRHRLAWAAEDGFEAMILASGIATPALKGLVGRERPREGDGSLAFAGGESFPSGEVAQAFALASVFARHYPQRWVDGLSWSLASVIAWQRIEADAHWASDVVAGAVLGTLIGRWVVGRNAASRWSLATDVEVEKREVGVTARYRIGGRRRAKN